MGTNFPELIRVVFNEYGTHVPYAADLAEQLNVPLVVHAPVQQEIVAAAEELSSRAPRELDSEMIYSVREAVRGSFQHHEKANVTVSLTGVPIGLRPEKNIFVSCDTETYRGHHILSPGGEGRVFRANKGPILVPLGDGDSSIVAAARGIALAQTLGTEVIFWHTTWKNVHEKSADPRKHVYPTAEAILSEAEQMGRAANVTREACRVECAETVVESIIRVALRSGTSLVVMPRGKRKKYGAYADRVRARNCPVPLLILAREKS